MMVSYNERQAFLIVTKRLSKHVVRFYRELQKATLPLGDVFILYHIKPDKALPVYKGVNILPFTNNILQELHYRPIRNSLVPGSNHFPVLNFFLTHPEYQYYWCIEDDVAFSGNWKSFFEQVSGDKGYDFITSHIRRYHQMPDWNWWDSLRVTGDDIESERLLNSFNPIYRISRNALEYIDMKLKSGCRGHHEVLLPSLLSMGGFSLADFSSVENHVTQLLSFCTLSTMRYKPVFVIAGNNKNKLYHPVKEKLSLKEFIVYVKRTMEKRKQYLT
ncbi:MAG: DUF3405 domain-containing protein [Chitinophagaceae bacterium]|nr:DUF3405 domain-containing protein [Chitinophagaceae bacterium]